MIEVFESVYTLGMWTQIVFLLTVLSLASYLDYKHKLVPRSVFFGWFIGASIIHYLTATFSVISPQIYAQSVFVSVCIGLVISLVFLLINAQIGDILTIIGVAYTIPILRYPFESFTAYYIVDISLVILFVYSLVVIYSQVKFPDETSLNKLLSQHTKGFVILGLRHNSTILTTQEYSHYLHSQNIESAEDITQESIKEYYSTSVYPIPTDITERTKAFTDLYTSETVTLITIIPLIVYITLAVILFLLTSYFVI